MMAQLTIGNNILFTLLYTAFLVSIFFIILTIYNKKVKPNLKTPDIKETLKTLNKVSHKKIKVEKEIKKPIQIPDNKYTDYNIFKTNKSKWSISYWRNLQLDRKHPHKTWLIHMEMLNGFHISKIIKVDSNTNTFNLFGKTYIVDNSLKTFNLDSKLYQLFYHESIATAVNKNINVDLITKSIKASKLTPVNQINPYLIEKFIQSKILEGLMKAAAFIETLKKLSFYLILILAIGAIHLFLFIWASGMLDNLNLPI